MGDEGRWVFVGRARAQAHPQFKLSTGLWLSALYFTLLAGVGSSNYLQLDEISGLLNLLLIFPILNLLAAVAIVMLWPFAYFLVMGLLGVEIGLIFLFGRFGPDPMVLAQVVAGLAVGMYFAEGGRPNLIYRHRYYSRKAQESGDVSQNPDRE